MPEISATHNQVEYSVSEVAGAIKRVVEDAFGYIRLRGEISGLKVAASGHVYLCLKDDNAVLDAVCWKGTASRFSFKPEDGLEVICTGRVTTYPGRSKYQLVIEQMEPAGVGALMALLEERRKKLAAEGLFAPERKRPLPFLPQVIGVVTSPTGAVIRDILHRISDRFPRHVLVWPVLVQGEGSAEKIAAAIDGFNLLPLPSESSDSDMEHRSGLSPAPAGERKLPPRPDVLIVARGGGSIEDLWAFNEEVVVRAAANSQIPLISAVGHETDTTLIDYASDQRAPTPTAAAEFAVPVREEWRLTVREWAARSDRGMQRYLQQCKERVQGLARGIPNLPQVMERYAQRLDDWSERLHTALPKLLAMRTKELAGLRLSPAILKQGIQRHGKDLETLQGRLSQAYARQIRDHERHLQQVARLMDSLNYERVLERGFALVRDAQGHVVSQAAQVQAGQMLEIQFRDGRKNVQETEQGASGNIMPPKPKQGSLL